MTERARGGEKKAEMKDVSREEAETQEQESTLVIFECGKQKKKREKDLMYVFFSRNIICC